MTIPTIEDSAFEGHTTFGNSGTITLSLVTPSDGDYILLATACDFSNGLIIDATSVTNGWVEIVSDEELNDASLLVWGKEYSTGDANPGFELVSGNEPLGTTIIRISGYNNAITVHGTVAVENASTAPTAPDLTTTNNNAKVFRICSTDDGDETVLTTPSTQLTTDGSVGYGGNNGFRLAVSQEDKATAGSVGTADFTSVDAEGSVIATVAVYGVTSGGGSILPLINHYNG